jgi:hypothetical protein
VHSLFQKPGEPGSLYESIRTSSHPCEVATRNRVDQMWTAFRQHADENFDTEFRTSTHARYWEMHLTCLLLDSRGDVVCPKPGPDVLLIGQSFRTWVEAVVAGPGDPEKPDSVADPPAGVVFGYPEGRVLLRYRNALQAKLHKFREYEDKGVVGGSDRRVIAVSGAGIPLAFLDHDPPDIVKAVLPFGDDYATVDVDTGDVVDTGFTYRPEIMKSTGNPVSTDIFLGPDYADISGVLFSATDISNPPPSPGEDLVFVHNPRAANPLPSGWLGLGREYSVAVSDQRLELIRTDQDAAGSS